MDPTAKRMAVSSGATIKIWDDASENATPDFGRIEDTLEFTEDGSSIYVRTGRDTFTLFDINSNQKISQFDGPSGSVSISPDKSQIVSCGDGVVVWDVEYGIPVLTLSNDDDFISVDWSPSPDNQRIAAGRRDGSVKIWTLPQRP